MKIIKSVLYLLFILLSYSVFAQNNNCKSTTDECTIGVASGKATSDGRPLIWKIRDNSTAPDNEVYFNTSYEYKFISIVNAGSTSQSWMGVNEKGFAILNSYSDDLALGFWGPGNATLMSIALGTCSTISEFEHLLDSTNITGRTTQSNYGVMDSTGGVKIIEVSKNQYWCFDANDTIISPNGYVLRTNFSITGGGTSGMDRFERTTKLTKDLYLGDSLNYRTIMRFQTRDFSIDTVPIPIPFPYKMFSSSPIGYIYNENCICRPSSVSATAIHGVLPGENAKLSTMWTMLGMPASTISVPYWPIGNVPDVADGSSTAPLCDIANQIKSDMYQSFYVSEYGTNLDMIDSYKLNDGENGGLWARTFPAEDSIFNATENLLNQWRADFNKDYILETETILAEYALWVLLNAKNNLDSTYTYSYSNDINKEEFKILNIYPVPAFDDITFNITSNQNTDIKIQIIDYLGKVVYSKEEKSYKETNNHYKVNINTFSSGIYMLEIQTSDRINKSQKTFIVK